MQNKLILARKLRLSVVVMVLMAGSFATYGIFIILRSHATTSVPTPAGYQLAWNDEFDGTTVDTAKWGYYLGGENHSQSYYTTNGVSVANGLANVRTRRHCTATSTETLVDANATTGTCPVGKLTRYSSGYLQSKLWVTAGRLEVRAKLPATQVGLWPAIWLRNSTGWCTPTTTNNYGELDAMEWYGDTPYQNTDTSHFTCTNNSTKKVHHSDNLTQALGDAWHIWSVEWDGSGARYQLDGVTLPSSGGDADKLRDTIGDVAGVSPANFAAMMNQPWNLRLNTQVTSTGNAYNAAPDPTKPFAVANYQIDYVRVFNKSTSSTPTVTPVNTPTPTLTPTPTPKPTPSPGQDTIAPTASGNVTGQAISSTQINLNWTAATDNVGVNHYRVTRDNGNNIGSVAATSFIDTTVRTAGYHTYIIYAVDAAGNESAASNKAAIILPAASPTPTPITNAADLNGDSKVNVFDFSILLSHWGTNGVGDIDKNGTVNIFDLSRMLTSWTG